MLDEFAAEGIDPAYIVPDCRMVGTEALQVVIEMRQIDQGEGGLVLVVDISRTVFDPLTRDNVSSRSPESKQGKLPESLIQFLAEPPRLRVDIRKLSPVSEINRSRRDCIICRRMHVVPPEEFRAGELRVQFPRIVPDLLTFDEQVGLSPEKHLSQVAEVPAVGYDAVLTWQKAGCECGLNGTGDGGRDRRERSHAALPGQCRQVRRIPVEQIEREADDVKDENAVHKNRERCPRQGADREGPSCPPKVDADRR